MIRIEASEEQDIVTLFLSGRMQKDDLGELKSVLARHTKSVVLDLSGVNLIDRDVVKFLASFETARAKLANCPRYIREWILRERTEP